MKANKKWLWICMVSLGMVINPVHASGIPVIDGAAIARTLQNIKNMIRGKLNELAGFDVKAELLTPQQITDILANKKKDCHKIANPKSKGLCIEIVNLEKVKMELARQGNQEIDKKWQEYQQAVRDYNATQIKEAAGAIMGNTNTGKLETEERRIASMISNMDSTFQNIELQMKIIDSRIELLRKARVQIVQEQMKGSSTIASSLTKAGVVTYIDNRRKSIQSKAKNLRQQNNQVSNDEFNKHSKLK